MDRNILARQKTSEKIRKEKTHQERLNEVMDQCKLETPFHIEGSLRHKANIIKAFNRFGSIVECKLIDTQYFGDKLDRLFPTIVCCKDESLILGKPRFPDKFTRKTFMVEIMEIENGIMYFLNVIAQ